MRQAVKNFTDYMVQHDKTFASALQNSESEKSDGILKSIEQLCEEKDSNLVLLSKIVSHLISNSTRTSTLSEEDANREKVSFAVSQNQGITADNT